MASSGKLPAAWNLSPLFAGDDDPQIPARRQLVSEKSYKFIGKWKKRRDYLTDPAVLKTALDEYEEWMRHYAFGGDEMYYFDLRTSQDENNTALKARYAVIEEFSVRVQNDIQFFALNIAKIPAERQKKFLGYAGLFPYRHFLERLFLEARHTLSDREEKILNLKSITSYSNWVRLTSGFLSRSQADVVQPGGQKARKNFTEIMGLLESGEKPVRDSAGRALNAILKDHADIAEAEVNSLLMNKKVDDDLRGFARPDSSRHLGDDIETAVVDTVAGAVAGRFDLSRRYYRLKADILGVKQLKYHERNIPVGEIEKEYSYEESVGLIGRVFRRLDPEFYRVFDGFVRNGQVDVYPAVGKRSGAFCAHYLASQPTYILLNHTGKLTDVLTFAHELGHGINNELVRRSQNALNFGTPTSTAEVASTFMEDFVFEALLKDAAPDTRLAILMKKLNDDVSSVFRQIAAYRFEQELHASFRKKGYLSKAEIGTLFQKHMADYMGPAVEQSPGSENWWVYWNHIRYFFYVYSYASGLLISKALQHRLRSEPAFMGAVKRFLAAGRSRPPAALFHELGIDLGRRRFWEDGLAEVRRLLDLTEDLAKQLKVV